MEGGGLSVQTAGALQPFLFRDQLAEGPSEVGAGSPEWTL